jgi:hypothetical protein
VTCGNVIAGRAFSELSHLVIFEKPTEALNLGVATP